MSQSISVSRDAMKTFNFFLTFFLIKAIDAHSRVMQCIDFSGNSKFVNLKENSDILHINHFMVCSSDVTKTLSTKFSIKWESNFYAENFNEVAKFYFDQLKAQKSANFTILSVNSEVESDKSVGIDVNFDCKDLDVKKCSEAVREVLGSFKSEILSFHYGEEVEMIVNTGEG